MYLFIEQTVFRSCYAAEFRRLLTAGMHLAFRKACAIFCDRENMAQALDFKLCLIVT